MNSIENDQDDGYGIRGSVRVTKQRDDYDIFFEPFVRYWHIDDLKFQPITYTGVLVGFGLEPENETLEAGLRIGFLSNSCFSGKRGQRRV